MPAIFKDNKIILVEQDFPICHKVIMNNKANLNQAEEFFFKSKDDAINFTKKELKTRDLFEAYIISIYEGKEKKKECFLYQRLANGTFSERKMN